MSNNGYTRSRKQARVEDQWQGKDGYNYPYHRASHVPIRCEPWPEGGPTREECWGGRRMRCSLRRSTSTSYTIEVRIGQKVQCSDGVERWTATVPWKKEDGEWYVVVSYFNRVMTQAWRDLTPIDPPQTAPQTYTEEEVRKAVRSVTGLDGWDLDKRVITNLRTLRKGLNAGLLNLE